MIINMVHEILLAEFENPKLLLEGAKTLSASGYTRFDSYSPFPIHGMDDAIKLKPSKLGWIALLGGTTGLLGGFGMQTFMSLDYKYIISGKPFFSYPAFLPVTFELMILFTAFATVFGMFYINKLPMHYHPLFKSHRFKTATSHGFFLGVESSDPLYNRHSAETLFNQLGCQYIEVIKE